MITRAIPMGLVVVLASLVSPLASAQTRDPAIATELFNAGRDLMKKGDFATACPKLASSLQFDPKVGTMARLAECEEKVGQLVNARAHWAQAINLARAEHDDRLPLVDSEFKRLDTIVPKVDVELGAHPAAGASLHVDGTDLGFASFGVPVPVEPGAHRIAVTAGGKQDWTQTVETKRDGAVTRLEVPALADAPVSITPPAPLQGGPAVRVRPSSPPLRVAGIVIGAAGLVAAGVGVAFVFAAKSDLSASNRDGCNGDNCAQPGYSERNDARTAGDLATGFVVAGSVLAATGLTLGLLSTRSEHPMSVAAGPGSVVVSGSF